MAAKINRATKAFVQYSKKMCTAVAIFWMIYRVLNFLVVLIRPEIANALVDLSAGVDTIMIVNISTYTGNSICEKASIAFSGRKSLYSAENKNKSNDEESNVEENDNG